MSNPIRNVYPTKDKRWIMLGMTNAQHYWPVFCQAIDRPELENDPKFATFESRQDNAEVQVKVIEAIFLTKTYNEWIETLSKHKLVWSPVRTPLGVSQDEQAIANDFFMEWDHPDFGKIKVLNTPIKLSETQAEIQCRAPELGEHTDEILTSLDFSEEGVAKLKASGVVQ